MDRTTRVTVGAIRPPATHHPAASRDVGPVLLRRAGRLSNAARNHHGSGVI
ncbi:MAG: hypothetical protein ACRCYX_10925 [Dermatophilaceae bacterium]